MNKSEWTETRKKLCDELWDNCAQEEPYCKNGLGVPCDMVLEAEKKQPKNLSCPDGWEPEY